MRVFFFFTLMLLAACAQVDPTVVYEIVRFQITATPKPSSTPEPSATPTPTPTPTAIPATVRQYPREMFFSEPVPQGNAPCGIVDWLDFPLDPPDAENAIGGSDFGIYRRRYDKFHAGEDWRLENRSFGESVYSIGHGVVTYAEPLGWGADKGVVIVEHRFSEGDSILSFYGHLDPPSIVLRPGDCVARGDRVGRIGRPRGSPHLHFEIRSHMPVSPGPGYWSVDPAQAGWRPPSQYIWDFRIGLQPGVEWALSLGSYRIEGLGLMERDDTYVVLRDQELIGIHVDDGTLRWSLPISETNAALDVTGGSFYVANQFGRVAGFDLNQILGDRQFGQIETPVKPDWKIEIDSIGIPALVPSPGGGVIMAVHDDLFGISPDGTALWERLSIDPIHDWMLIGGELFFTSRGETNTVWKVGDNGPEKLYSGVSGHLVASGDQLFVYERNGIYRLNTVDQSVELIYPLSTAYQNLGDMVALPDGGLLLSHVDNFDRRIIAIDADGTSRWERSFIETAEGQPRLLVLDDQIYLILEENSSSASKVSIYLVDTNQGELNRILTGGRRGSRSMETRIFS
ncbi:MAG: peptidoglycan DD-metalloendopeptidase family protein, partial [Anaerolineales bacterium]